GQGPSDRRHGGLHAHHGGTPDARRGGRHADSGRPTRGRVQHGRRRCGQLREHSRSTPLTGGLSLGTRGGGRRMSFKAVWLEEQGGKVTASVKALEERELPPGDVVVRVEYSTLNYKDG